MRRGAVRHPPGAGVHFLTIVCLFFAAGSAAVQAQDPPHWASVSKDIDCTSQCHVPHQAAGAGLSSAAANAAVCQSCHVGSGLAGDLPIADAHRAVPGSGGTSHAFGVGAVNATLDTQLPQDAEMQDRIMSGEVVCSTCHNQHAAVASLGGESRVGNAVQITALGSTGAVTSGGTFTGPEGVWYLVEITAIGSATTARFRYSKDSGLSWFPTGCAAGNLAPCLTADTTSVALDAGVSVTFSGSGGNPFQAGERWEFAAAWPFLRASLTDVSGGSAICRDCHRTWVNNTAAVEQWNLGAIKGHPTAVGLPVHPNYRTVPLDGNGADQGSGSADGNPTNDLALDGSSNVQCLTCHSVHFTDSNTETLDTP